MAKFLKGISIRYKITLHIKINLYIFLFYQKFFNTTSDEDYFIECKMQIDRRLQEVKMLVWDFHFSSLMGVGANIFTVNMRCCYPL